MRRVVALSSTNRLNSLKYIIYIQIVSVPRKLPRMTDVAYEYGEDESPAFITSQHEKKTSLAFVLPVVNVKQKLHGDSASFCAVDTFRLFIGSPRIIFSSETILMGLYGR